MHRVEVTLHRKRVYRWHGLCRRRRWLVWFHVVDPVGGIGRYQVLSRAGAASFQETEEMAARLARKVNAVGMVLL